MNCCGNWPRRSLTVIVLCDRGLASPKLWQQIRVQGWHPYMRYAKNVTFCADGGRRLPARAFVPRPDTAWIGSGTAFSTPAAKRRCTLLAVWYAGGALDHPDRPAAGPSWSELVRAALLDRVGLQEEPGMEVGQDQENRPGAHLPALAGAVGGDALALAYGTRVEDANERRIAPGSLRAACPVLDTGALPSQHRPGHRPRRTGVIRHGIDWLLRLLEAASGAGSGCCPNPGRNPSPTWRSPAMPTPENPIPTPVRGAGGDIPLPDDRWRVRPGEQRSVFPRRPLLSGGTPHREPDG